MIRNISVHLPEGRVTNEDLAREFPDWTAGKIFAKTGIRCRRVAGPGECASDLAAAAAAGLVKEGRAGAVDFLLFCTQSPDYVLPTTACVLQDRLGLPRTCGALDFNLGCSGYVYGLALAKSLIEASTAHQVLLLTADTYTRMLHAEDRGTRAIFGDAGTATLLTEDSPHRLTGFVFGTDGSGAGQLMVEQGGFRVPGPGPGSGARASRESCVTMNGPEVFNFTLECVPAIVERVLEKTKLRFEDIDRFVFHQANGFMLEHLRRKMGIPPEKFSLNFAETGNTVSSSIPLALHGDLAAGRLRPGMKVLLVGFGVGLSSAGCVLEWKE